MDKELFEQLTESMRQMGEIVRGERAPSREFHVDSGVREVRLMTGLSQAKFAALIGISKGTLQNYEQGRRSPQGPTRALFRAISKDPQNVLAALADR